MSEYLGHLPQPEADKPIEQAVEEIQQAENFVERTFFKVDKTKSGSTRCVDGRYEDEQNSVATPGGDFGRVLALLAYNRKNGLGLKPEECVDSVYKIVTAQDEREFSIHTDEHAEEQEHSENVIGPKLPATGCGHIRKAMENPAMYGLETEEVAIALNHLKTLEGVKTTILEGKHEEKGVLVIKDDEYTVPSQDGPNQYFIYNQSRDLKNMRNLVNGLNNVFRNRGIEINPEEFLELAGIQLNATLQNLALGKPIFEVSFEKNDESVTPIVAAKGRVEKSRA